MFVDSHCHINFPELAARMGDVRAEMAQAQVDRALVISTTLETFSEVHGLALAYDNFWCTAGVHPDNEGVAEPTVAGLLELAAKPKPAKRTPPWPQAAKTARPWRQRCKSQGSTVKASAPPMANAAIT